MATRRFTIDRRRWEIASTPNGELQAQVQANEAERQALLSIAKKMYRKRKLRSSFFSPAIFGEPGWDLLLVLYIEQERSVMSMSELTEGSSASRATALRWISYLEQEHLVESFDRFGDKRFRLLRLTEKGNAAMSACLKGMRTADETDD